MTPDEALALAYRAKEIFDAMEAKIGFYGSTQPTLCSQLVDAIISLHSELRMRQHEDERPVRRANRLLRAQVEEMIAARDEMYVMFMRNFQGSVVETDYRRAIELRVVGTECV